MKRATFGLCTGAVLGVAGAASAGDLCETITYCDTFDTYQNGLLIGQDCVFGTECQDPGCDEGAAWEAWDANPAWGLSVVADDPDPDGDPDKVVVVFGPDDLVQTYKTGGTGGPYTTGVYQYTADLFIPSAYSGETYFILLNTYTGDGNNDSKNWSTQVHFNTNGDQVLSDFDDGVQNEVGFVRGEWKTIRVIMDLDNESANSGQQIYYDDQLVIAKSWVEGVSGGGASSFEAVDLFANGASDVYWDNLQICELSPLGACCFADSEGTCDDGVELSTCMNAGGVFQGFGSQCGGQCPKLGPEGWELEAPFTWDDSQGRNDSCDYPDTCDQIYEGPDIQFDVTIPWPSNWTFSTAGSETQDTEMLLGNLGLCSSNLVDDGGCVGPGCIGTQDEEGTYAVFTLELLENEQVLVNLEEFSGDCGKFDLSVQAPCPTITLPKECDPEPEPCEDPPVRENDGCNMEPGQEAFTDIALGQYYCGTSRLSEGGTDRDTDWYQIVFTEEEVPNTYEISVYGEFGGTGVGGWIQYNEGSEGSGSCDDISGFISPFGTYNRCSDYPSEGKLVVSTEITVAGTYWIFVGPAFGGTDFNCDSDPGADYYVCVNKAVTCTLPEQEGDADNSGCVEFDDLLLVLSTWGTGGPDGDVNCDGSVNFDDLLEVLSNWDKGCPGACCLPEGLCVLSDGRNDCEDNIGGEYRGNGSSCEDPFICVGACCIDDVCVDTNGSAACELLGGVFQGGGTRCEDGDCD